MPTRAGEISTAILLLRGVRSWLVVEQSFKAILFIIEDMF